MIRERFAPGSGWTRGESACTSVILVYYEKGATKYSISFIIDQKSIYQLGRLKRMKIIQLHLCYTWV